jgi:hypothetical protein
MGARRLAAQTGGIRPRQKVGTAELIAETIVIHGVRLRFAVRQRGHLGLIREHVSRETNGYAILKDAIAHAKVRTPLSWPRSWANFSLF